MITFTKKRSPVKDGDSRKPVPVKRVRGSAETTDDILGRYLRSSSEERFDLFFKYRGLRDDFSVLDRNEENSKKKLL